MITPDVTTSSSSSSLFIPNKILGEIVSHCDASTFAVVSRVSSACLELASPFLYTDIVVKDLESVIDLFRLSPSFGDMLPKTDRVSLCTSLSLVYSITVHLGDRSMDYWKLPRKLRMPPPLVLPVFIVSVPGSESTLSLRIYNISALADLVNPRTFIVHGREPELDIVDYRPSVVKLVDTELVGPTHHWDRLKVVLHDGASSSAHHLLIRRQSKALARQGAPPLQMIVDLASEPDGSFAASELVASFVKEDIDQSRITPRMIKLKSWVRSEESKKAVEEEMKSWEHRLTRPWEGDHAVVEVIDERLDRFKEELALGARKDMDWAVLDAM